MFAGAMALAGCQPPANTYPVTPPVTIKSTSPEPAPATMPTSSAPAVMAKIPADAKELSSGMYPPPAFDAPSVPGLILVADLNGDPTVPVASTAYVPQPGPSKKMSVTDVPNMTITLNKDHQYRVVFVPNKSGMP